MDKTACDVLSVVVWSVELPAGRRMVTVHGALGQTRSLDGWTMRPRNAGRWWNSDPRERYWIEVTNRSDIGANLKFPKADETGKENRNYALFLDAVPGDIVFHYDGKNKAIVGRSIIAGPAVSKSIHWAARGTSARGKGTTPYDRPGWVIPLENHVRFERAISSSDLRRAEGKLREIWRSLQEQYPKRSLYFPFTFFKKQPLRMSQSYALKMPRTVVELFPEMRLSTDSVEEEKYAL